jgi:hypothetical protein
MLKVYIEFENNTETYQYEQDESYTKESWMWGTTVWGTGPVGKFEKLGIGDGSLEGEDIVHPNYIHKICPKITKVMLIDTDITNLVTSETETRT